MEGKDEMTKASSSLQDLRRGIYVKAKAEPSWRFWGLYVHVCKMETLQEAYLMAKKNHGAPGIDGVTFADIEAQGAEGFLQQIRDELTERTYVPLRARKKEIPKDGGSKVRVLSIPAIRDRVVQGALKLILEPIFEADFQPGSYGYRPKRTAHQAVDRVAKAIVQQKTCVIDLDLKAYFDTVRHHLLLDKVALRVRDDDVMHLLRLILKASGKQGVPQGGVITPRTQKVISSLSGEFRCAGRCQSLTYDARGNMFVSNVAIQRRREGPTLERCIRSAQPRLRCRASRGDADRGVRVVATPGLSLLAGGSGDQASSARRSAERCHHRQGPGGHRREAARACAGHGYDDWRRGLTCRLGLADSGAPAWLSATRAAKFASSIALTVCSAPSSSRPMTSWFPIAPAAPAGTLE